MLRALTSNMEAPSPSTPKQSFDLLINVKTAYLNHLSHKRLVLHVSPSRAVHVMQQSHLRLNQVLFDLLRFVLERKRYNQWQK